jgi:hypothetical protein
MSDEAPDPVPPRIPKYKAPDFMRKEIELFLRARNEASFMRRYGDDDAPVPAITPLSGIGAARAVRRKTFDTN